jgi:hypothetical protein
VLRQASHWCMSWRIPSKNSLGCCWNHYHHGLDILILSKSMALQHFLQWTKHIGVRWQVGAIWGMVQRLLVRGAWHVPDSAAHMGMGVLVLDDTACVHARTLLLDSEGLRGYHKSPVYWLWCQGPWTPVFLVLFWWIMHWECWYLTTSHCSHMPIVLHRPWSNAGVTHTQSHDHLWPWVGSIWTTLIQDHLGKQKRFICQSLTQDVMLHTYTTFYSPAKAVIQKLSQWYESWFLCIP